MADMRKPLFDLSQVDMQAELNSYMPGSGLAWPTLFPLRYTPTLDIKSLEGNDGIPVSADVIAFNAKAPQKTRKTIGTWSGQVAKVAISRQKDEKQIKEYQILRSYAQSSGNPNVALQLVDMVYEDVQFCYEGVNYLAEDLDLQVGSKSAIVLKTENNNDVVTQNALNFNIPSAHKTGVKNKWSASSDSDPLGDIIAGQKAIQKEGFHVRYHGTSGFRQTADERKDRQTGFACRPHCDGPGKQRHAHNRPREYLHAFKRVSADHRDRLLRQAGGTRRQSDDLQAVGGECRRAVADTAARLDLVERRPAGFGHRCTASIPREREDHALFGAEPNARSYSGRSVHHAGTHQPAIPVLHQHREYLVERR